MYRKVNERVVTSDDQSFELRLNIGRCLIEYREGERLLEIEIERASDPLGIVVYSDSLDEWDSPSNTKIDAADKDRILNHIKGSLDLLDCQYRVC